MSASIPVGMHKRFCGSQMGDQAEHGFVRQLQPRAEARFPSHPEQQRGVSLGQHTEWSEGTSSPYRHHGTHRRQIASHLVSTSLVIRSTNGRRSHTVGSVTRLNPRLTCPAVALLPLALGMFIRHEQVLLGFSPRRRDQQTATRFDSRLTLKDYALASPSVSVRILQNAHSRRASRLGICSLRSSVHQFRNVPFFCSARKLLRGRSHRACGSLLHPEHGLQRFPAAVVRIEFHRLFARITPTVSEPTNHPLFHSLTTLERSAVRRQFR